MCKCTAKDDPLVSTCDGAAIPIIGEGEYPFLDMSYPLCPFTYTTIHVAENTEGPGFYIDEVIVYFDESRDSRSIDVNSDRFFVSNPLKCFFSVIWS